MLTTDQIAAIRERCDKATPEPWGTEEHKFQITSDDFCFVCHAREDIPALLDALEEAETCKDHCAEVHSLKTDVHEIKADRDRWKARCEAMERAMKALSRCGTCVHGHSSAPFCDAKKKCEVASASGWQFYEARFAGAGGDPVD